MEMDYRKLGKKKILRQMP